MCNSQRRALATQTRTTIQTCDDGMPTKSQSEPISRLNKLYTPMCTRSRPRLCPSVEGGTHVSHGGVVTMVGRSLRALYFPSWCQHQENRYVLEWWCRLVGQGLHHTSLHTPHTTCGLKRHLSVFLFVVYFLCYSFVNVSLHWVRVRQNIAMLSALTACGGGCSWVEALQCLVGRVER